MLASTTFCGSDYACQVRVVDGMVLQMHCGTIAWLAKGSGSVDGASWNEELRFVFVDADRGCVMAYLWARCCRCAYPKEDSEEGRQRGEPGTLATVDRRHGQNWRGLIDRVIGG